MRKSREEAAETRERIVDTAAHEFGPVRSALGNAQGLTNPGFFANRK